MDYGWMRCVGKDENMSMAINPVFVSSVWASSGTKSADPIEKFHSVRIIWKRSSHNSILDVNYSRRTVYPFILLWPKSNPKCNVKGRNPPRSDHTIIIKIPSHSDPFHCTSLILGGVSSFTAFCIPSFHSCISYLAFIPKQNVRVRDILITPLLCHKVLMPLNSYIILKRISI